MFGDTNNSPSNCVKVEIMIRIICPKCKNAYLMKEDGNLSCPSCEAVFSEDTENLLLGAQYYNEGAFSQADDYLMKYIVKNGADPEAMFYKALCGGFAFDEDTLSLKDVYTKLSESLEDIDDDLFIRYLALANDEAAKLEELVAQSHIRQFETADSEKIKKEVSVIINLQNDARDFRAKLTQLADSYNERANEKISVNFSSCYLVNPEIASEVGVLKFEKVKESIDSHTVFTGILSTEIKNLEIYYRCIVMFFESNRQKYDFLMESAEKFNDIAKLLEGGRYTSIKGVPTIANKLKSAAYDFFQESLKDHDDEFDSQTQTVTVLVPETVEIPEEAQPENADTDITSDEDTLESDATDTYEDVYSNFDTDTQTATVTEEAEETPQTDINGETPEGTAVTESEAEVIEIEVETAADTDTDDITENADVVVTETELPAETTDPENCDTEAQADPTSKQVQAAEPETEPESEPETESDNTDENSITLAEEIKAQTLAEAQEQSADETSDNKTADENSTKKAKHKKSYGPFIAVFVILLAIAGLIAVKVVPAKLNAADYEKAQNFVSEKKYGEAALIFDELGDYEDSKEKALECKYNNACALESAKKYNEAVEIFNELGDYEDSAAKKNSCIYNGALATLDEGKYDEAAQVFKTLDGYADSDNMIKECSYQKAISLISAKDYEGALAILDTLGDYSETETRILEAKYGYVSENLDAENETTISYLKDLSSAKYKDSGDLRNKLLGTSDNTSTGVTSCINYTASDTKTSLSEVDKSKITYFHVVVSDERLYGKQLTVDYTTSMGYHDTKSIVLSANANTYAFPYPSTDVGGYTVEFKLLSNDGTTLTTQKVLVN